MAVLGRALMIALLVVGVPATLGAYRLAEQTNAPLCYASLGVLLLLAISRLGHVRRAGRLTRQYWILFGVLAGATIPVFVVDRPSFAEQFGSLATCLIWSSVAVSLATTIRTSGDLRRAFAAFNVLGAVMVTSVLLGGIAVAFLGFEFGEVVNTDEIFRAFGPLGDQVAFAILPATIAAVLSGRLVPAAFCVAALLLTGTRGALIALGIAALWLVVTARQWFPGLPRRQRRRLKLIAAGSVLMFVAAAGTIGGLFDDQVNGSRSSYTGRRVPFALGVEVASDNPILGVGFLGFRSHAEELDFAARLDVGSNVERNTYTTQNQFVQTATDAGIPGLLALIWLIVVTLRCFVSVRRAAPPEQRLRIVALEAGFVGLTLGNQSAVWLLPTASAGYVVFILCALAWRARDLYSSAEPQADALRSVASVG